MDREGIGQSLRNLNRRSEGTTSAKTLVKLSAAFGNALSKENDQQEAEDTAAGSAEDADKA